ncbi:NAD(P)H-binding protein [Actinomycetaceae bacterium L2_0104]
MKRINILGGTGYAGSRLAREAVSRGHKATSFTRSLPEESVEGVDYRAGDLLDATFLASAFEDADVVISALSPRGTMSDDTLFRTLLKDAARVAAERGVRFGVIGGAGSLFTEEGGPLYVDTPDFPEFARAESRTLGGVLEDLQANSDEQLDWFMVSPAAEFGAHVPGTRTGHYRVGNDVLLYDDNGVSAISGDDLAIAIVDEIEKPVHHRGRFTVGY